MVKDDRRLRSAETGDLRPRVQTRMLVPSVGQPLRSGAGAPNRSTRSKRVKGKNEWVFIRKDPGGWVQVLGAEAVVQAQPNDRTTLDLIYIPVCAYWPVEERPWSGRFSGLSTLILGPRSFLNGEGEFDREAGNSLSIVHVLLSLSSLAF